jgi:hypothetical protein
MAKESTIVVKVEKELKDILQNIADSKKMSLSAYTRYALGVGLDEIHRRNVKMRELEKQLKLM